MYNNIEEVIGSIIFSKDVLNEKKILTNKGLFTFYHDQDYNKNECSIDFNNNMDMIGEIIAFTVKDIADIPESEYEFLANNGIYRNNYNNWAYYTLRCNTGLLVKWLLFN